MPKRRRNTSKQERRISVRGIRRVEIDVQKLGRALIALALEQTQAEVDAEAVHQRDNAVEEALAPVDGEAA